MSAFRRSQSQRSLIESLSKRGRNDSPEERFVEANSFGREHLYQNRFFSSSCTVDLTESFNRFDLDESGTIDVTELVNALSALGLKGRMVDIADGDEFGTELVSKFLGDWAGREHDSSILSFDEFAVLVELLRHREAHKAWVEHRSDVFLGGSCNPTTWRQDIAIPYLKEAGATFYNPQVDEWHEDLISIEEKAKLAARILFFVIDNTTRSMASMLEATEYIMGKRTVVLVVQDVLPGTAIDGVKCSTREIKDLNRARAYLADIASRHGLIVFSNVTAALEYSVRLLEQQGVLGSGTGGSEVKKAAEAVRQIGGDRVVTEDEVKDATGGLSSREVHELLAVLDKCIE